MESVNQNVETFASAQGLLDSWNGDTNCVFVLDVRMPGMSGMILQDQLRDMSSVVPIIFITGYGDVSTAVQAMRNGAFDFVQKPFRNQDLIDTIQDALAAGSLARKIQRQRERALQRLARLTHRERQVLDMIVDGKRNKVIASDLALSQRTVEVHRASVMRKMDVDSVAALVRTVLIANDNLQPPW